MQKGAFKFVQPLLAGLAGWACSAGMLLLSANASAQNPTAPFTFTDDRGRVVVIEKAPQRVITLVPSLGEIVCELKACDLLVGVDRYSNWPERVKALPKKFSTFFGVWQVQCTCNLQNYPAHVLLALRL